MPPGDLIQQRETAFILTAIKGFYLAEGNPLHRKRLNLFQLTISVPLANYTFSLPPVRQFYPAQGMHNEMIKPILSSPFTAIGDLHLYSGCHQATSLSERKPCVQQNG